MNRRRALLAAKILLVAGCKRANFATAPLAGAPPKEAPCVAADAAAESAPAGLLEVRSASLSLLGSGFATTPWHREQGCAASWARRGGMADDLARLGALCAEGMTPLWTPPISAEVDPSAPWEVAFTTTHANACLRAAIVGDVWPTGLAFALFQGEKAVAVTFSREPVAVIPAGGPHCLREPGEYRLVFQGTPTADGGRDAGSRAVLLQVWEAAPDE